MSLVAVVADDVREMLDEIAAEGDVEDLRAAADREHGEVARERRVQQRQLGAVALGRRPPRLGVRLLAVELGVEVGAAREDEPVERARASRRSRRAGGTSRAGRRRGRRRGRSRTGTSAAVSSQTPNVARVT